MELESNKIPDYVPNKVGAADIWRNNQDLKNRILEVNEQNRDLRVELRDLDRDFRSYKRISDTLMVVFFIVGMLIGYAFDKI